MSIFVACRIPKESIISIREVMRLYQDDLISSVPQEQWHCTILFLGNHELSQTSLTSLMKPIRQIFHPVVKVLSVGQGKAAGQLWAYIQPSQLLQDIHSTLLERIHYTTGEPHATPQEFIPHIHIGNIQEGSRSITLPDAPVKASFSLRELVIFESNPAAPHEPYAQLGTIPITS